MLAHIAPRPRASARVTLHGRQTRYGALSRTRAATDDNINPATGLPYSSPEVGAPKPPLTVQAGDLTWAYRKSTPIEGARKAPVLMLHGLGSSSYGYRELMSLLAQEGHECYAPDWPGHGGTDKPASFAYDEASYISALDDFVNAVGIDRPFFVVTHGFVLGQYGLLWTLKNAADVERLLILGTPLGRKTKLRSELAAYKNPFAFLRPKPDAKFAGDLFNATGLAFVIAYDDAQVYDLPYQEGSEASAAVYKTMENLDWQQLLNRVDEEYCSFRKPACVLYGNKDPFLDVREAMDFLETKRTTMQLSSIEGALGHMPHEDFAAGFSDVVAYFFEGGDVTVKGTKKFVKDKARNLKAMTGDMIET